MKINRINSKKRHLSKQTSPKWMDKKKWITPLEKAN